MSTLEFGTTSLSNFGRICARKPPKYVIFWRGNIIAAHCGQLVGALASQVDPS